MSNVLTNLQRTVWADSVQSTLETRTAGMAIANTAIAEPIQFVGQTLRIPYLHALEAQDTATATFQGLSAEGRVLTVDFDKTVAFKVEDREAIATGQDWVSAGAAEAGRQLRKAWDTHILSKAADITINTLGGGAGYALTNVLDALDDLAEKMDELELDDQGRFIVVNAKVKGALRSALSSRETTWGDSVGENGYVDMARGVRVYLSNNTLAPNASAVDCIAGIEGIGLAAVAQITPESIEVMRDPDANYFGFRCKTRCLAAAAVYLDEQLVKVRFATV